MTAIFTHFIVSLAGLDLGVALILLYEFTRRLVHGKREWFGYTVFLFAYGVLGNFLVVTSLLSNPNRVRPGYVLSTITVVLILAGWSMADMAYTLRKDRVPIVSPEG